MASTKKMLAFDLGAESGRGVLGLFDGNRLRLEVVHRFPNGPVRTLDSLHWDVLRLYSEMLVALRKCAAEQGGIDGLGIDTEGVMEEAFRTVPRAEIFRRTGLQFMRCSTLFQLLALKRDRSPLLDAAET